MKTSHNKKEFTKGLKIIKTIPDLLNQQNSSIRLSTILLAQLRKTKVPSLPDFMTKAIIKHITA